MKRYPLQTASLVDEISNSSEVKINNPMSVSKGRYGGTYVCKELVYAYAMWISAPFQLKVISANQAVLKKTGENVLSLLGHKAIEAEKQSPFFIASELAAGVSGRRMNKMLESAGLQHNENGRWIPDDGGKYSRIFDTGKTHGSGAPVTQVKWSRDVLAMLQIELAA